MIFKKRVSEPEQEMNDKKEVEKYFLAHQKLRGWNIYDLISRNILKNVSLKKGNVLDIACGYGGLMKGISKYRKKFNFTGIDLSSAMINAGKKYIANRKIKFALMSADNMKFDNGSFDLVLCKDAFHHFNDPVKVLKEMYRVLKKGGQIYAIDLRRDVPEDVYYRIIQGATQLNIENATLYVQSVHACYTIKEMKQILKKVGIKKYKIFVPKIDKNFLRDYNLRSNAYLQAADYLKEGWVLIVRK